MSSAKATPVGLASPSASSMMRTAITPPANKKPSSSRRNSKIDQEHKHKLIIEWIHEYALKHNISSISRATTDIISRDEGNMSELVEQRNLISAIREMLNIPRNTLSVDIFMRLARPLLSLFDQEPKSSLRIKKQFFMTVYMEGGGDDDELTDLYHEMFHTPDEENAVTQLFHQLKQYERNQELSSSSGESEHDDILHDEIPDIDEGAPSQRQQRNRSQDDTDTNQPPRVSLRRRVRPLSLAELRDMIYDFLDSVESRLGSTALDAIYKDVENGKYVPFQRKLAVFQGDRRSSSVHHSNDTPQGNLSPRRSSSSFSSPGMSSAPNVFTVDNLKQCVTEWHHDQGLPGSPEQLWNDIVQQKHGDIIDFKAKMGYLDQEQKPNQRNAITREIRDYRDDNNDNDNDDGELLFDDNGSVVSTDGLFDLNYRTPQPEHPLPPRDAVSGRPASDLPPRPRKRLRTRQKPSSRTTARSIANMAAASSSRDVPVPNEEEEEDYDEYNEDGEIDENEIIKPPRKSKKTSSKKSIQNQKKKAKKSKTSSSKQTKENNSDEIIWADLTPSKEKELQKQKKGRPRRRWTDEEVMNLKKGVKRFGKGYWKEISLAYSFNRRTTVDLKDKWRLIENTCYKRGVDPLDGVEL